MRPRSHRRAVVCDLLTISTCLILLAAGGAPAADFAAGAADAPDVQCPPPTEKLGNQCVLKHDANIEKSLRLASDTKLNCQGHRLTPKSVGSGLVTRSVPEVAIFLNGVQNVLLQNCVIDGFDFGIFAVKSKVPAAVRDSPGELAQRRNKILGNTVNARFLAVALVTVDNTEVKENSIKYTAAGGKGVYVGRDSDMNRINNNKITGDIASATSQAVGAPGPVSPSNPVVPAGQAVLITQTLGPDPTLLNAIIEGELYQLPVSSSPVPNADFSEDNLFEGNTVVFTQTPFDGVVISVAQRTTVSDNIVRSAAASMRVGFQSGPEPGGLPKKFPGMCTAPAGRACLADADCNILGTSASTCSNPAPPTVGVFWVSDGNLLEGNTITGPFTLGIATTGSNTVIRGNTITGPLRTTIASSGGISLVSKFALGPTTTVTRNVVSNVAIALNLLNSQFPGLEATALGARVSLNDFTGYTTSVRTDIAATLSTNGQGNFWGLPCPQGFDPSKVQRVNPTVGVVTDDHPYGAPVARAATLPQPCR
jgi:parallel beta-helix repeat protein